MRTDALAAAERRNEKLRAQRLREIAHLDQADRMSGPEFEQRTAELFADQHVNRALRRSARCGMT
jgi:hypothetical protein